MFGGTSQQDAQEFYSFIMDNLHDETNMRRNMPSVAMRTYTSNDSTVIQNAMDAWRTYRQYNASIIDRYFRGLDVVVFRCVNPDCGLEQYRFEISDMCILSVSPLKDRESIKFERLLDGVTATANVDGSRCEKCKTLNRQHEQRFARLPDRLAFCIGRFEDPSTKLNNMVRDRKSTRLNSSHWE